MAFPTSCSIKGCPRYINLDEPLPSNRRFICPECEDAIATSLLERLARDGYCSEGAKTTWIGVLKQWRWDHRQMALKNSITLPN